MLKAPDFIYNKMRASHAFAEKKKKKEGLGGAGLDDEEGREGTHHLL